MKNFIEKSFHFLVPCLFIFPLFKENISSVLFIILSFVVIVYSVIQKDIKIDKKTLIFTIPFWIILLYSILNSDGVKPIKQALFFLIFPIVFSKIPKEHFTSEKLDVYFKILKNACLIIALGYILSFMIAYDFADFFVYKYGIPKFRDFVYNETQIFKIHPTYYTSIVIFCCAYCFERVLKQKIYYEIFYIIAFIFITFLLLSKINIVFLAVLLLIMLLFRSPFTKKQKLGSAIMFLILATTLCVVIPGIKNRFTEVYQSYNNKPTGLAYDSTNIRVAISKCSFEIAKENYLWGVGFNKLKSELNHCFENNYDSAFYKNHNYLTHNYYVFIFLTTGIFGFIAFAFYLFNIIFQIKKINCFLLYVSIANILLICMTEDYLYRHFGLFYFSLILYTFINFWKFYNTKFNFKEQSF